MAVATVTGQGNADLRAWRWSQTLSQRELAALAKCSRAMIAMIESGRRAPSLALAKRLSQLTGVPLDKF